MKVVIVLDEELPLGLIANAATALGETTSASIRYLGLCIYGEDATVRSLTGNLPLLGSRKAGSENS
jgi:hypothetical protein